MLSKYLKMRINSHEPCGQAGIIPEKEEMYLAFMEEKKYHCFHNPQGATLLHSW